jgi:hypothetical protein
MMFVKHDRVEADILGVDHLIEVFVVEVGALLAIEEGVWYTEICAVPDQFVLGDVTVRTLGEVH